jgi:serine phosphatase RsbU (regulator of sigma subunit)/class 3 adenylate cyclase
VCGHPVSVHASLEDLYFSRLATNAPPEFIQKIRTAPYLAKERRIVTAIMFSIANLDSFNRVIPEEERTPILNQALDRFAKVIFEYEGTIAKLWKNTVLAFFGAPISHEDDPFRAVQAAQAILKANKAYSDEILSQYDIPMQLNLVINTGPVLIGGVKSNLKFDFQSINNTLECLDMTVNAAVPRCEVILFEDTYRFLKPFIECQKLDEIYCEDLHKNLNLWQLVRVINGSKNIQRLPATDKSVFVGRQKELELLLELAETVLAGLGRVGVISGEPGIGKSRLIVEWKKNLPSLHQPTRIRWIEAQGLAISRELAYHMLKNLLRNAMEVPETASIHDLDKALKDQLESFVEADSGNLYLYLAHVLDIPLPDASENRIHQLNAQELHTQYSQAIQIFFRRLAMEQPLIIVLEDLHWADASSVDLLAELLTLTSSSPILFILVSRYDYDASGWQLITTAQEKYGPRLRRIELSSFDAKTSELFVKQITEIEDIPDVIRSMVLEKSEGNPYFIEELIYMLVNEGVLIKQNNQWAVAQKIESKIIPDSLQGLLTARIDRLPAEARTTLRVASVIGKTFSERALEKVMKIRVPDLALMEQLSTLESNGMIKVAQVNPELVYKFQHILIHDAAYHSIIESDRSELHLTVGKALEELYPDQKKRLASELAHHFQAGQDPVKALEYLDLAGHVVMDSFAHAEAENYFSQAIQLAQDKPMLAHLYTDLGEALSQQGKHREAIQAWNKAIRYHRELKNHDRLARVYAWSARSAWWGYDPKRSLEICQQGLKDIEGAEESPDVAYLVHETGRAYLFNNQPEKARAYSEQALEIAKRLEAYDVQAEALATIGILPTVSAEKAIAALEMAVKISESNNLYGPASRAYINLAAVIDNLGKVSLARDYRKRAIEMGNKAGGVADELLVNQTIAQASLWLADFDDAETRINKMRLSQRQKDAYLNEESLNLLLLEGNLARLKGQFSFAINIFTDLIDRSRQTHDIERLLQANQALAEVILESYVVGNQLDSSTNIDIALNMIKDAVRMGSESMISENVSLNCLFSDIYTFKGDFTNAQKHLKTAQKAYREQPGMKDHVRILLTQSRLASEQNQMEPAIEYLNDSIEILERLEARWWRARTWFEIGNLHLRRQDPEDIDQAQSLYRDSLAEFKEMGVETYPDVIIEQLRKLKQISRAQAIAHHKVNRELAEAGRVQNTFIPTHSPNIPGYEVSGVLLPARETSGDFYDFIDLEDGNLAVVIADVGDKGAGAALYMAMSRTLIRTYAGENKLEPAQVIQQVNRRLLSDTQHGIFLTVVLGVLNPKQGTFTYVNAGHNPPYLLSRSDQGIQKSQLDKTGTLVGIFSENTWEAKQITLKPGEALVLFTDGITEAQDESGAFYGSQRLVASLERGFSASAEEFRNNILQNLSAFTGSAERLDDITLIVISRKEG